jgi:hypothetical protein
MDPCAGWKSWRLYRAGRVAVAPLVVPLAIAIASAAVPLSFAAPAQAGPTCQLNIKGLTVAQCWNAPCELLPGGKEAKCVCPLCTQSFVTPGGDCNPANCTAEILVGEPFPVKGGGGCKSK